MPETSLVQAHVDPATREEAEAVLASIGMTVSQAVRLMLMRVARNKALPFEQLLPNEITFSAMTEERERNGIRRVGSVAELMVELNADGD